MGQNGVSDRLLKLFQNYLNNRKHRMGLNGFSGGYSTIEFDVPRFRSWSTIISHFH